MPELLGFKEGKAHVNFPNARRFTAAIGQGGKPYLVATPDPHEKLLDGPAIERMLAASKKPDLVGFWTGVLDQYKQKAPLFENAKGITGAAPAATDTTPDDKPTGPKTPGTKFDPNKP